MSQENNNNIAALARVTHSANGGAVTPTYGLAKGFTSNATFGTAAGQGGTHSAAGVYVLVLDNPVDPALAGVLCCCLSTTADDDCIAAITNGGQTITCTVTRAGAASDAPTGFYVEVKTPPNG